MNENEEPKTDPSPRLPSLLARDLQKVLSEVPGLEIRLRKSQFGFKVEIVRAATGVYVYRTVGEDLDVLFREVVLRILGSQF